MAIVTFDSSFCSLVTMLLIGPSLLSSVLLCLHAVCLNLTLFLSELKVGQERRPTFGSFCLSVDCESREGKQLMAGRRLQSTEVSKKQRVTAVTILASYILSRLHIRAGSIHTREGFPIVHAQNWAKPIGGLI